MRVARFVFGLVATSVFTGGLFFLPIVAALLWRSSWEGSVEAGGGDTGLELVASWDGAWAGGGGVGGDGSDAPAAEGETTEEALEGVTAGTGESQETPTAGATAPKTGGGSAGSGGGRGGGSGSGSGTGNGPGTGGTITMYRPEGERPTLSGGSGGRGPRCEPLVTGIVATGPDAWSVERTLVDEYANLKMAKTLLSGIERHQNEAGEYDGVQIFGLPCGGPLQLAGLKHGDVIHDINGHPITGIPAGLLAWRKLRNDDVLEVNVTRKGRSLRLVYTLS